MIYCQEYIVKNIFILLRIYAKVYIVKTYSIGGFIMLKINIQNKLAERNLNKNQFAKLMQIGYPAACALYNGTTTRISFDTLENICKVLNCTPNEILISDDPQVQRMLMYASKFSEKQK